MGDRAAGRGVAGTPLAAVSCLPRCRPCVAIRPGLVPEPDGATRLFHGPGSSCGSPSLTDVAPSSCLGRPRVLVALPSLRSSHHRSPVYFTPLGWFSAQILPDLRAPGLVCLPAAELVPGTRSLCALAGLSTPNFGGRTDSPCNGRTPPHPSCVCWPVLAQEVQEMLLRSSKPRCLLTSRRLPCRSPAEGGTHEPITKNLGTFLRCCKPDPSKFQPIFPRLSQVMHPCAMADESFSAHALFLFAFGGLWGCPLASEPSPPRAPDAREAGEMAQAAPPTPPAPGSATQQAERNQKCPCLEPVCSLPSYRERFWMSWKRPPGSPNQPPGPVTKPCPLVPHPRFS